MKKMKSLLLAGVLTMTSQTFAQKMKSYETTEGHAWVESLVKLGKKALYDQPVMICVSDSHPIEAFGTTFNELDWEAMQRLSHDEQEEIMHRLFDPEGDLRFTRGRLSMNANDYAMGWYSCDTVAGDFELRYFNIERDKRTILTLVKQAQKYQPALRLWMSPWSPPAWMKINQDYPVLSSRYNQQPAEKDYLLFGDASGVNPDEMKFLEERKGYFPRKMATQNYMIQDSRYLQCYADMFCRFIELYAAEGAPIDMVMYQNEAYSYTPYPGCAWTADGTIRFNNDYLVPILAKKHPEVKVYTGTFNTNRQDYVEKILSGLNKVDGIGFQWEGREMLGNIRKQYPDAHLICSESECGNGSMDWNAGEHTFFLLSDNLGNGCDEYYNWNFILQDNGISRWGWTQNALVQVDSKTNRFRYTDEFYAMKHFSHFLPRGSRMLGYNKAGLGERRRSKDVYVVVFATPEGKHVVTAGNFADESKSVSVKLGDHYLNVRLSAHSMNTFVE